MVAIIVVFFFTFSAFSTFAFAPFAFTAFAFAAALAAITAAAAAALAILTVATGIATFAGAWAMTLIFGTSFQVVVVGYNENRFTFVRSFSDFQRGFFA